MALKTVCRQESKLKKNIYIDIYLYQFSFTLVRLLKAEKPIQRGSKAAVVPLAFATIFPKLLRSSSLHLSVVMYLVYVIYSKLFLCSAVNMNIYIFKLYIHTYI